MKAIIYRDNGGPDVLQLVERDVPEPGPGEVRVRVAVSGVNPTDWQARSGVAHPKHFSEVTRTSTGLRRSTPSARGSTGKLGERVWLFMAAAGRPTGTAAEFTVVPAERAMPLPDEAGFDVGAALGVPALTAHRALTVAEDGPRRLRPAALDGRVVLAAGGASAVGHAVIQLARWAGATVIGTVSGRRRPGYPPAYAHHVINYREGDPPPRSARSPGRRRHRRRGVPRLEPRPGPGRATDTRHDLDLRQRRRQAGRTGRAAEHGAEYAPAVPGALHSRSGGTHRRRRGRRRRSPRRRPPGRRGPRPTADPSPSPAPPMPTAR